MFGRRIGIWCGLGLVAWATTAAAQTAPPALPPLSPAAPYEAVPATFNQPPAAVPAREPRLLTPPNSPSSEKLPLPKMPGGENSAARTTGGGPSIVTTLLALAAVLGLFLGLTALVRRGMPQQARALPPEAVEMLGRIALPGRRQGHLLRVGNKITLVSFSNVETRPLVEITDPQEVDRLAGLCKQVDPTSATGSFRAIVDQFFREKSPEPPPHSTTTRSGRESEGCDE